MSIKVRSSLHSLVIIAVLIFSAVGPTIAYADGGTTTDTPPTETTTDECTSDGTSSECSTEAAAVDTTATPEAVATEPAVATSESTDASAEATATEEPVADGSEPSAEATALPATEEAAPPTEEAAAPTEAAPATEEATAPTEAAPAADATVLNAVPENTTVEVVNADGQSEPLASQAAADAIATTTDPIWCPAGQAPGSSGCTISFNSFNELLNFLSANSANPAYQGPGTIFVEQGTYHGGESSINFNNYNLSNISNANLTITGGWNILDNTTTSTSTFNNVPIVIGSSTNPWGGALTINNLSIGNTGGTGLTLYSQTDINLTNVNVTNSTNGAGAQLNAVGDVTIENSNFERNKTAGAIISHAKNVTIRNSSFSNPANARRQATGLDVTADGSVSLLNVLADQNRNAGATINAGGFVTIGGTNSFSGTKNMVGSSFFGYGLTVVTKDSIAVDGVTANDNFLWGASLTADKNVTVSNSIFNANTTNSHAFIDDTGLIINSLLEGYVVNLDFVQANSNRLTGATIHSQGDVNINDSIFTNNKGETLDAAGNRTFHGYGLQVISDKGSISINRVDASNNNLFGAHLDALGDVTISSIVVPGTPVHVPFSTFSNNGTGVATAPLGRGLEVISHNGSVFLDTTTINNNQTFGANIQASADVFLSNVTATGNGTNGVEVKGNCTTLFLINGTYSNNGQYGLSIINMALNQSGTQNFGGNLAGDIFQDPGTCIFPASVPSTPATPSTPPVDNTGTGSTPADTGTSGDNTGSTPIDLPLPVTESVNTVSAVSSGGSFNSSAAIGSSIGSSGGVSNNSGNVTLNTFLASARFAGGTHVSLFMGKYVYIYSKYGIQIFAYYPTLALDHVARIGPH